MKVDWIYCWRGAIYDSLIHEMSCAAYEVVYSQPEVFKLFHYTALSCFVSSQHFGGSQNYYKNIEKKYLKVKLLIINSNIIQSDLVNSKLKGPLPKSSSYPKIIMGNFRDLVPYKPWVSTIFRKPG